MELPKLQTHTEIDFKKQWINWTDLVLVEVNVLQWLIADSNILPRKKYVYWEGECVLSSHSNQLLQPKLYNLVSLN